MYGSTTQYTTAAPIPTLTAPPPSMNVTTAYSPGFSQSFFVTDSQTGQPVANRAFIVLVDGHRQVGLTDANGLAIVKVPTANSVIELHVVFQAPARDLSEFSEEFI